MFLNAKPNLSKLFSVDNNVSAFVIKETNRSVTAKQEDKKLAVKKIRLFHIIAGEKKVSERLKQRETRKWPVRAMILTRMNTWSSIDSCFSVGEEDFLLEELHTHESLFSNVLIVE